MNGPSLIEHQGLPIVLLDFAGIHDPEVGLPLVSASGRFVQAMPADRSALVCTDVTDTKYDRRVVEAFKVMTTGNAPHVKASVVVTESAIHRAAVSMIALFSRRKFTTFDTRAKALDWLVCQK